MINCVFTSARILVPFLCLNSNSTGFKGIGLPCTITFLKSSIILLTLSSPRKPNSAKFFPIISSRLYPKISSDFLFTSIIFPVVSTYTISSLAFSKIVLNFSSLSWRSSSAFLRSVMSRKTTTWPTVRPRQSTKGEMRMSNVCFIPPMVITTSLSGKFCTVSLKLSGPGHTSSIGCPTNSEGGRSIKVCIAGFRFTTTLLRSKTITLSDTLRTTDSHATGAMSASRRRASPHTITRVVTPTGRRGKPKTTRGIVPII